MEVGLSIFAIVGTMFLPFVALAISLWRMGASPEDASSDTPEGAE